MSISKDLKTRVQLEDGTLTLTTTCKEYNVLAELNELGEVEADIKLFNSKGVKIPVELDRTVTNAIVFKADISDEIALSEKMSIELSFYFPALNAEFSSITKFTLEDTYVLTHFEFEDLLDLLVNSTEDQNEY